MTARDMQGLQLYSLFAQHRHAVQFFPFRRGGEGKGEENSKNQHDIGFCFYFRQFFSKSPFSSPKKLPYKMCDFCVLFDSMR
jgi:hypothetical protein